MKFKYLNLLTLVLINNMHAGTDGMFILDMSQAMTDQPHGQPATPPLQASTRPPAAAAAASSSAWEASAQTPERTHSPVAPTTTAAYYASLGANTALEFFVSQHLMNFFKTPTKPAEKKATDLDAA